jgi:catechol 2,3-dioxygenase-like lactoylglutathione lyase family enzyme
LICSGLSLFPAGSGFESQKEAAMPSSPPSSKLKLSFDAVFYYVTDMEASIAFYRDTLGLPLVSHDFVACFDLDGVLVELVPAPPGTMFPGNGNARLCFEVSDLKETVAQLHACGVATTEMQHKKGGELAFFRDPDGNELCLWQYDQVEGLNELVKSAEIHR